MKKFIILFSICLILLVAFVACKGKTVNDSDENDIKALIEAMRNEISAAAEVTAIETEAPVTTEKATVKEETTSRVNETEKVPMTEITEKAKEEVENTVAEDTEEEITEEVTHTSEITQAPDVDSAPSGGASQGSTSSGATSSSGGNSSGTGSSSGDLPEDTTMNETEPVLCPDGHDFDENRKCRICAREESKGLAFTEDGEGVCYVSGIGSCTDTDIIIPERSPEGNVVVTIGSFAFDDQSRVKSIYIPNTVKLIDVNAFRNCKALVSIRLPESLESVAASAFSGCEGIKKTDEGIEYVEKWAVGFERRLTEANIKEDTVGIAAGAFESSNVMKLNVPASVRTINYMAFCESNYLSSVTFAEGSMLKEIGKEAFYGCDFLCSVEIPSSVENIGDIAFEECVLLEKINFLGTEDEWNNVIKGAFWDNNAGVATENGRYTVVCKIFEESTEEEHSSDTEDSVVSQEIVENQE